MSQITQLQQIFILPQRKVTAEGREEVAQRPQILGGVGGGEDESKQKKVVKGSLTIFCNYIF